MQENIQFRAVLKVVNMKSFLILAVFLHFSISDPISLFNDQCRGLLFEALPNPEDDHSFIGCIQGKATIFQCPNGEFFDELSVTCTAEYKKDENEKLINACENLKNVFVAHPDDCGKFIYCDSKEKPQVNECDVGHVFNPDDVQCWRGNTETCEIYRDVVPSTEEICDDDDESCEDLEPEEPATCEDDDDDDDDSCDEFITTTEEPTTTPTDDTTPPTDDTTTPPTEGTTPPPTLPPSCGDTRIRFTCPSTTGETTLIAHPRDCTRYQECNDGQAVVRLCDEGLYFDIISSTCKNPNEGFCAINISCACI